MKQESKRQGRLGQVIISIEMMHSASNSMLSLIFKDFFPVHCEFLFHRGYFKYIGFSKHFDKHIEGDEIPEYELVISLENKKINWKKV